MESVVRKEELREQLELLMRWNKEKINKEPEQVRRNIETIVKAYYCLLGPSSPSVL